MAEWCELWWQDRWSHCRLRQRGWRVTPMDRAVSPPSLSFGELCSCDMWICSEETCQNDHWSENKLRCQRASTPHAAQTDTNTANKHTLANINTWKSSNTLAFLSTHWNVNHSTYPIQPAVEEAGPHRRSWTHVHVYTVNVFMCGAVSDCATALLNNTSVAHQNFKAQHTLRKGRAQKERQTEVGVGGLQGETKTKIQDIQWWEGQTKWGMI